MQYSSPNSDKEFSKKTIVFIPEEARAGFEPEYSSFYSFFSGYFFESYGRPLLDGFGLESVVSELIHREENNFFSITEYRQGYISALAESIDIIRSQAAFAPGEIPERFKGHDGEVQLLELYRLHELVEVYLKENEQWDLSRALDFIEKEGFSDTFLARWGNCTALVRGFQDFSFTEQRACDLLSSLFKDFSIRKELPGSAGVKKSAVVVLHGNDRYQETVALARYLKAIDLPWDHIRLYIPDYRSYSRYISQIFPGYGIPIDFIRGRYAADFPVLAIILRILSQSVSGDPFRDRAIILRSTLVRLKETATPGQLSDFIRNKIDPEHQLDAVFPSVDEILQSGQGPYLLDYEGIILLEREAFKAGYFISGQSRYFSMCRYLLDECGNDSRFNLKECIIQLYLLNLSDNYFYHLAGTRTSAEFVESIDFIIDKLGLAHHLSDTPAAQFLKDTKIRFTRSCQALGSNDHKFRCADLSRLFSRLMNEYLVTESPGSAVSIECLPIETVTLKPCRVGIIMGLNEGIFPSTERINFIIPRAGGDDLFGRKLVIDSGKAIFKSLCGLAEENLILTYSLSIEEKPALISPFLTDLKKECKYVENPVISEYYSNKETDLFIGSNVDSDYPSVKPLLKKIKEDNYRKYEEICSLLTCQGKRKSVHEFSEFDGIISFPSYLQTINSVFTRPQQISPETLEKFAHCPMRFLFDDLCRFDPAGEDYTPDTSRKGKFLNELVRIYTTFRLANKDFVSPINKAFLDSLNPAIEDTLKRFELDQENDVFTRRQLNGILNGLGKLADNRRTGIMKVFLESEDELPDKLLPLEDQSEYKLSINGHIIKGKIDRVECDEGRRRSFLYLYTTGEPPRPEKISAGLNFSLPLALAALSKNGPLPPAVGGYISLKNAGSIKRGGYLGINSFRATRRDKVSSENPVFSGQRGYGFLSEYEFEAALYGTIDRTGDILDQIHNGGFNPPLCREDFQSCFNCRFRRICRKDQIRLNNYIRNMECT